MRYIAGIFFVLGMLVSQPALAQKKENPWKIQQKGWSDWATHTEKDADGNIEERKFRLKKKKGFSLIDEVTNLYNAEGKLEKTITKRIRTSCNSYKELRVREKTIK